MINKISILIFLIIFTSTTLSQNTVSEGQVIKIIDGDTVYFQAKNDNRYKKLRLVGIDAPEIHQPFGLKSKQCLGNLINNKPVKIMLFGTDRYKRTLAKILTEEVDINLAMIKEGCAWFYRRYKNTLDKNDQLMYDQAEVSAIDNKKGLFSNHEAEAPWNWRKKN